MTVLPAKSFFSLMALLLISAGSLSAPMLRGIAAPVPTPAYTPSPEDYARIAEEGLSQYKAGNPKEALELLEYSVSLAPTTLEGTARNNLAALHMKEAAKTSTPNQTSLEHLRQALYWMETSWPNYLTKSAVQDQNTQKAQQAYTRHFSGVAAGGNHAAMAKQLQQGGKLRSAMVEYHQALQKNDKDTQARRALATLFTAAEQYALAIPHLQALVPQVLPNEYDLVVLQLANALYRQGEMNEALEVLNTAIAKEDGSPYALRFLERFWLEVLKDEPNNVLALMNAGGVNYRKGLKAEAKSYYEQAERILSQPNAPEVEPAVRLSLRTQYAQVLIDEGNTQAAIPLLNEVLQYDTNHAQAVAQLWRAYFLKGQATQATSQVHAFLNQPVLPLFQARYLIRVVEQTVPTGQVLSETLMPWVRAHSQEPALLQAASEALMQNRQWMDAKDVVQMWQALSPENPEVFDALATVYQASGQNDQSHAASVRANELRESGTPKVAEAQPQVPKPSAYSPTLPAAFKALSAKQYALASSTAKTAIINNEDPGLAYYYLGLAQEGLKQAALALEAYQKGLEYTPNRPETHYALGVLQLKQQQRDQALKHLQRFVSLMEQQPQPNQDALATHLNYARQVLAQSVSVPTP